MLLGLYSYVLMFCRLRRVLIFFRHDFVWFPYSTIGIIRFFFFLEKKEELDIQRKDTDVYYIH